MGFADTRFKAQLPRFIRMSDFAKAKLEFKRLDERLLFQRILFFFRLFVQNRLQCVFYNTPSLEHESCKEERAKQEEEKNKNNKNGNLHFYNKIDFLISNRIEHITCNTIYKN